MHVPTRRVIATSLRRELLIDLRSRAVFLDSGLAGKMLIDLLHFSCLLFDAGAGAVSAFGILIEPEVQLSEKQAPMLPAPEMT